MKKFLVILLAVALVAGNVFAADSEDLENQVDQLTKRIEYLESLLAGQAKEDKPAPAPAAPSHAAPAPAAPAARNFPQADVRVIDISDLRALERRINRAFYGDSFGYRSPRIRDFMGFPEWDMGYQDLYDYAETAAKQLAADKNAVKAEIDLSSVDLQQGDLLKVDTTWKSENQSGKQSFVSSVNNAADKTYSFTFSLGNAPATMDVSVLRNNEVIASNSVTIDESVSGSTLKVAVNPVN